MQKTWTGNNKIWTAAPSLTTSSGAQAKYYDEAQRTWYKQDYLGTEGLSEYAACCLLNGTDLAHASYLPCRFRMGNRTVTGCRTKHFLQTGECLFSSHRLIKTYTGIDIEKALVPMSVKERIRFFVDTLVDITGYADFGRYLTKLLQLDAVIKNDDRHFNNISFVRTADGCYVPAPVFDNGGAFLSDQYTYGEELDYNEVLYQMQQVQAKPFSRDFDEQLDACEELYPAELTLNRDAPIDFAMLGTFYTEKDINKVRVLLAQAQRKYPYLFAGRSTLREREAPEQMVLE